MPDITCIIVSHNKPEYVREAVDSVSSQKHEDWLAILVDSGDLYDVGFFDWVKDDRIQLVRSAETGETRRLKAPAPWCFNECFRKNMVKTNLVTYLCDDDVWYDNAFGVFVNYWKDHPEVDAMYASQDVTVHAPGGKWLMAGERRALEVMGKAAGGPYMDCVIDYLQFCHTVRVLDRLRGDYWPEHKITENHADGVFMDKIGSLVPVHPIDIKIGQNRRTPKSIYIPMVT